MTAIFWICIALAVICLAAALGNVINDADPMDIYLLCFMGLIFMIICLFTFPYADAFETGTLARFLLLAAMKS